VPCSGVRTVDQVVADPHVATLGMVREWKHDDIEDFRLIDHPISYNGVRSFRQEPPPNLGEHSHRVLAELGYDADEIAAVVDPNKGLPQ
jgi:crotonobetainyl-CoA:carnitine CoA-transferase CaiB-like acyl-CoA transferase